MGNRLKDLTLILAAAMIVGAGEAGIGSRCRQSTVPPRSASSSAQAPAAQDATDVLGVNAACLVCHLTFVKEPLARSHQLKSVSCSKCHGASLAHANDEHVGATRPDITYSREQVDKSCKSCHRDHDVPAAKVIARFLERKLPSRRAAICTDCHGAHRIESVAGPPAERE